jgi:hypothetical protein
MATLIRFQTEEAEWMQAKPCPVCSAAAGCRKEAGGEFVSCSHCPSEWPLTDGSWLHRLASPPGAVRES